MADPDTSTPATATVSTTTQYPGSDTAVATQSTAIKSGWKTSEMWMKLAAMLLTALYVSDVIPTSGPATKIAAVAATMLGALGYTIMRTKAKS